METYNSSLLNSTSQDTHLSDNTVTFIVGFSILILFVVLGMLASAFLCLTLKKDPYLWEAERERQHQEQAENDPSYKERDKMKMMDGQQSTQI